MSTTVKSLKVSYDPGNESNTFTSGDRVSGQVALEVAKDCEVSSLRVQFKGKAEVLWTERHGQTTVVYHSKDKYFSIKHYFIRDADLRGERAQLLVMHYSPVQKFQNKGSPKSTECGLQNVFGLAKKNKKQNRPCLPIAHY